MQIRDVYPGSWQCCRSETKVSDTVSDLDPALN